VVELPAVAGFQVFFTGRIWVTADTYKALWGTGTAADVIVWEKTRFDRRSRVVCSLPGTVVREGKLLYSVQSIFHLTTSAGLG